MFPCHSQYLMTDSDLTTDNDFIWMDIYGWRTWTTPQTPNLISPRVISIFNITIFSIMFEMKLEFCVNMYFLVFDYFIV